MVAEKKPGMFRPSVLDMKAYSPPLEGRSRGDILRLDFNERTTPPHTRVVEKVRQYTDEGQFQVYPEYGQIERVVADYAGVQPSQVMVTNGSDQAIDIIYRAIVERGDKVIMPRPTFAMLEQSAQLQGADIVSSRYRGVRNLQFPFQEVMDDIDQDTKLVVICNPNNPTGTTIELDQTEAIVKKAKENGAAVLVDEAYHEFMPDLTAKDLIYTYDNVFVTRSFSKIMGIAGLRAGYVISRRRNIRQLRKVRGPYDVTMPAARAVMAIREPEVQQDIRDYVEEVMGKSKPRVEAFYRRNGIKFFPSRAGFHLIEEGQGFTDFMETQGVLVRPRRDPPNTTRVSIGTSDATDRYLAAFEKYIAQAA